MFELLFNYPRSVFSKGEFVLLGAWPKWVLVVLLVAAAGALAWLIRSRLPQAAPKLQSWRASMIWLLQTALAAVVLVLLWQPAIMVAELRPQQNIIAVLVDDSRSMAISDNGAHAGGPGGQVARGRRAERPGEEIPDAGYTGWTTARRG